MLATFHLQIVQFHESLKLAHVSLQTHVCSFTNLLMKPTLLCCTTRSHVVLWPKVEEILLIKTQAFIPVACGPRHVSRTRFSLHLFLEVIKRREE